MITLKLIDFQLKKIEFISLFFLENKSKAMDEDICNKLEKITLKNSYIKKANKQKNIDKNSLIYLINRNATQSQIIKMGIALEKILNELITTHTEYETIIEKESKVQKDMFFKHKTKKIIFYGELKSNINLDTEKSKATIEKINRVSNEIKTKYTNFEIYSFLINLRYLNKKDIPTQIINKYHNKISIIGINEFLNWFKFIQFENEINYKKFINFVFDTMFKNS